LPDSKDRTVIEPYWKFPQGLPITTAACEKARGTRVARRLLTIVQGADSRDWLQDPHVMHLGRLTLMLADHHYSSLTDRSGALRPQPGLSAVRQYRPQDRRSSIRPWTNICSASPGTPAVVAHALPGFERHLPRLARHKGLRKRSTDARFRWQDTADLGRHDARSAHRRQGAFIVNMASTGCGKTLANARIMNALADPLAGMRCAFALGLRTLTLQTGRAFRDELAAVR
jgi:CRISPR-associated endonuclease/helicase Cas3